MTISFDDLEPAFLLVSSDKKHMNNALSDRFSAAKGHIRGSGSFWSAKVFSTSGANLKTTDKRRRFKNGAVKTALR